MSASTPAFYRTIDALVQEDVIESPHGPSLVWKTCVRDVLADAVPEIVPEYHLSDGLRATPDDIGPVGLFELTYASFEHDGDTYDIDVEAHYEDTLPYNTPTARPVTPRDYGPAVVVYQLFGDVSPQGLNVFADVRAFPGTLAEFAPRED